MIIDQEELLKGLIMLKGRLSSSQYDRVFKKLVYDKETKESGVLSKILPYVAVSEENLILSHYVGIKWCTGGSKRKAYMGILRSQRGIEEKIKEELGELINE